MRRGTDRAWFPRNSLAPSRPEKGCEMGAAARHRRPMDVYDSTPRRIRGLDGLRAIAVAAVVVYHLGTGLLPGGFLGVDVFFVISGFLITTLLMTEQARFGTIRLRRFYARRARRLLPALLLVLAATALLAATVARDAIEGFRGNAIAALLYVSNWWYIGQEQSYFELIGRGNMLAHLWSLAVEEQFYLIWPAVVIVIVAVARARRASTRRALILVAGVGALASTAAMAAMSMRSGVPIDADPTRVYFGTDTHAMSVLAGAALAALWQPGRASGRIAPGGQVVLGALGAATLGVLAWVMVAANEYSPWIYRGGFLGVSLLVALLILVATHPASPIGTMLDLRALRWVGERSYGIYLWHWPIFLVTRPGQDLPWHGWWLDLARIALVLGIAEASYRWVEEPIREGALRRGWQRLSADGLIAHRRALVASLGAVAAFAAIVGVSFNVGVPRAADAALGSTAAITAAPAASASPEARPSPGAASSAVPAVAEPTVQAEPVPRATLSPSTIESEPAAAVVSTQDIAVYGDSVSLWAADVLMSEIPGSTVDAAINRSPGTIMGAVLNAHRSGSLRSVVVMHLGTAGPINETTLRDTLGALGDRARVVLVGSTARFAYVSPNNDLMDTVSGEYDNVVYADWPGYVTSHDSWLEDGLHLTAEGKPEFARFVSAYALTGEGPAA